MKLPDKIIDAHIHLGTNTYDSVERTAETLHEEIKSAGIEKAVLIALNEAGQGNLDVIKVAQLCDKIIPVMCVNPLSKNVLEHINELQERFTFKGLKLHPRLDKFSLLENEVFKVIERASELKLPVIIDSFPYYPGYYPDLSPETFHSVATSIPDAKIIIAHSCGNKIIDSLFVAKANKNVYLDLSLTLLYFRGSSVMNDIGYMIKKMNGEKIVYGSDYPGFGLQESLSDSINEFNKMDIDYGILEKVLYKNSLELFLP